MGNIMNFKQRYQYVLLDGPMGEYALKLYFCIFNKKTCAMLLSFLLHIMNGSPCIWALQNLDVKAWVTIVNL